MVSLVLLHGAAESWALSRTQLSRLETLTMIKERRLRWLRRSDNNMVKQLLFATRVTGHVQSIGRPCGTWMHYAIEGCEGHRTANGLPQLRMDLAERNHEHTYLGRNC